MDFPTISSNANMARLTIPWMLSLLCATNLHISNDTLPFEFCALWLVCPPPAIRVRGYLYLPLYVTARIRGGYIPAVPDCVEQELGILFSARRKQAAVARVASRPSACIMMAAVVILSPLRDDYGGYKLVPGISSHIYQHHWRPSQLDSPAATGNYGGAMG